MCCGGLLDFQPPWVDFTVYMYHVTYVESETFSFDDSVFTLRYVCLSLTKTCHYVLLLGEQG